VTQRRPRRAPTRAFLPPSIAAGARVAARGAPGAARAQALVDACNLGVTLPALNQIGLIGPLVDGVIGGVNANVVDVLSNRTLRVGVRDALGNVSVVGAGNCHLSADSLNVGAAQGVSIGGGRTTGLGATGAAAVAGHVSALAIGNGATTGAGLAGAAALGAGASSTVAGGVALGAGALAGRAGLAGAAEAFSASAVASAAGAVSVGTAGAERQIVNVAGGTAATDAVNVRQLAAVGANLAASLGAGAAFNAATGVYVNPGFSIRGTLYGDVGAALAAIDLRLGAASATGGGSIVNTITVTNAGAATGGGTGGAGGTTTVVDSSLVRQDAATRTITIGGNTDGRVVNVGGTEGDRRVTGVAQATAVNDAVNLAQLNATELRLTTMVSDVPIRGSNLSGRSAPAASGSDALAVGYGAAAAGANAVAIGNGASAAQANSVAIGTGAATTRANQVAVGGARSTYTLAGLPSAESAAAQSGPTRFVTTDEAGNLAASKYGPASVAALDNRVGAVEAKVAGVAKYATEGRREARQGVAAAMAMTTAAMPSTAGRTAWVMNTSTFRGEWAAGGALAHRLDTSVPLAVHAGYAYGGGNSHGVRVGLGGEF
jgi:trimeric autotransporter adhesin